MMNILANVLLDNTGGTPSKEGLWDILHGMGIDHPFWWIISVLAAGFVAGKIMSWSNRTTGIIASLTFGVLGGLLVRWICKLLPIEVFHNEIWYVWFLQGLIGAILIYAVINRLKR